MKIAIIIPSLAQKGPIIIAYELVKGLLSYGHNVSVFYFDNIIELHFPCEVNKIKLYEFWKIKGFDIIHTHCLRPDIFGFISKKIFKKTCSRSSSYFSAFTTGNLFQKKFRVRITSKFN